MRQVNVFTGSFMVRTALLLALLAGLCHATRAATAADPAPVKLKEETGAAFQHYVQLTDARNAEELKRGSGLLWIDALPETARTAVYAELKRGEVKTEKLETRENGEPIHCPGGMIHHWVGLIFIPSAKLDDVLGILEDYDRHSVFYAPDVERSKMESRDGDHFRVFLRFRRHKVITVVLNTEHDLSLIHI